jgi:hypothetical protein
MSEYIMIPDSSRSEILKFLSDFQSQQSNYHNHKENSAWAVLVFYTAIVISINTALNSIKVEFNDRIFLLCILLILSLSVFLYIKNQFELRRVSSSKVAACIEIYLKIISCDEGDIQLIDFRPAVVIKRDKVMFNIAIPQIIYDEHFIQLKNGRGTWRWLESIAYILLTTMAAFSFYRIFQI